MILTRDEEWLADLADQDESAMVVMLLAAGLTRQEEFERWVN